MKIVNVEKCPDICLQFTTGQIADRLQLSKSGSLVIDNHSTLFQ